MKVLDWFKENLDGKSAISLMAQYFPTAKAFNTDLNRKLTLREYEKIENYLYELDLKNGYLQDVGENEEDFVPSFDLSNIE
jgi:putative pyruvate formate lyase activating enzyme